MFQFSIPTLPVMSSFIPFISQLWIYLSHLRSFWIESSPCIICDGIIEQGSHWQIHLSDELINKIEEGGGLTERILTNLMETMNVYDSNIKVNLLQDGTGLMNAQIKANNALDNPIFLNYNHKENAFDLWDSINFGAELQQNLEYRFYQKRENK